MVAGTASEPFFRISVALCISHPEYPTDLGLFLTLNTQRTLGSFLTLNIQRIVGCPISRSFFARCGIPQRPTGNLSTLERNLRMVLPHTTHHPSSDPKPWRWPPRRSCHSSLPAPARPNTAAVLPRESIEPPTAAAPGCRCIG